MARRTSPRKRARLDVTRLEKLNDSTKELLFREYSAWARHHHVLVWTVAAFGVTIQLATLSLFKDLAPCSYTLVALGSLVLLFIANKLADGNRRQWQDYKSVANLIEMHWGLRDPNALDTQLNEVERRRDVRVQPWRTRLYWAWALILAATIVVKWVDYIHWPARP